LLTPNHTLASYLRDTLEYLGCVVTVVNYGQAATKTIASKEKQDHYILDLVGQDIGGLDVLKQLNLAPDETEKLIMLCPLVHRLKDKEALRVLNIKHICFTPVKIMALLNCMLYKDTEVNWAQEKTTAKEFKKTEKPSSNIASGLKILIADDDVENQNLIEAYLSHYDIEHNFTANGELAFDRYKQFAGETDLLITDVQMPIMDGFQLIKKVRDYETEKNLNPVPIVILTADAQEKQIEYMKKIGGNEYITKPVSKNALVELLSRYQPRKNSQAA
jgi:CheY-like chemotaxis protein